MIGGKLGSHYISAQVNSLCLANEQTHFLLDGWHSFRIHKKKSFVGNVNLMGYFEAYGKFAKQIVMYMIE